MISLPYISRFALSHEIQLPHPTNARGFNLNNHENSSQKANRYDSFVSQGIYVKNAYQVNQQHIDSSSLGDWLQSCSSINGVRKLHAFLIKYVFEELSVYVSNNLTSAYVKFGDLESARKVFDHMLERNVVSWTAMLNGYQKYGSEDEALRFLSEFVYSGIHCNAQTYVCMFKLCSRMVHYDLGRQIHACVIKNGVSNFILDSATLHFYACCGDLGCAFNVFDRMQTQDLISWTTMITACSQLGRSRDVFVMVARIISDGLDINEFTVCSALNACGEEKELNFGKQLHGVAVKKNYDQEIYIGTSLIDMYAKCAVIEDSKAVFGGMKRRNIITWNSMLAGYARNGMGYEAIQLFRLMNRLKMPTNDLTMVSLLRSCGLVRALFMGKETHAQIIKKFDPSNIFVGSSLVWLYRKCGEYSYASKVLQTLPDKDVVSWTAMISCCACLGHEYEAIEYLKEMLGQGVEPNPFTYSSALKACAKLEDVDQGRLIHSKINKTPSSSNVFVGSALVHMYSKCGHLSEAVQVFDALPEKNLPCWRAMIVAYASNGLCSEALKLLYRMQSEGVEMDDHTLSTVLTACGDFQWAEEGQTEQLSADVESWR